MNENMPPVIPGATPPQTETPAEFAPVTNAFAAVEALLRQPRRLIHQLRQPGAGKLIVQMILVSAVCAAVY